MGLVKPRKLLQIKFAMLMKFGIVNNSLPFPTEVWKGTYYLIDHLSKYGWNKFKIISEVYFINNFKIAILEELQSCYICFISVKESQDTVFYRFSVSTASSLVRTVICNFGIDNKSQPLKCYYDQIIDIHFFTFSCTIWLSYISCQISIHYEH